MTRKWLEKELEDAIADDPTILLDAAYGEYVHDRNYCRLLGRQVPCGTGIIDLLFTYGKQLYIVELKAVKATDATVGQTIRYKEAVKSATDDALFKYAAIPQKLRIPRSLYLSGLDPECIIVAPTFTTEAINTMSLIGQAVIARKDEEGAFRLSPAERHHFDDKADQSLVSLLKGYALMNLAEEGKAFYHQMVAGVQ